MIRVKVLLMRAAYQFVREVQLQINMRLDVTRYLLTQREIILMDQLECESSPGADVYSGHVRLI